MKHALVLILLASTAGAQEIHELIPWDKLSAKAVESTNITLDGGLLDLARRFLGDSAKDKEARAVLQGVRGIYVRTLEFDKDGQYSLDDVAKVRNSVKGAEWQKMVDVRSSKKGGDTVGIYMKTSAGKITGLVIIAAEPRELTVVNLVGSIDPDQIGALRGKFGIPDISFGPNRPKAEKEEEEE